MFQKANKLFEKREKIVASHKENNEMGQADFSIPWSPAGIDLLDGLGGVARVSSTVQSWMSESGGAIRR